MLFIGVYLFADAEAGEDGGEDLGGGDGAADGAEVVDCFADILSDEVAAEVVIEALDDAQGALRGVGEDFGMAGIGDEDVAAVAVYTPGCFFKCVAKCVESFGCGTR